MKRALFFLSFFIAASPAFCDKSPEEIVDEANRLLADGLPPALDVDDVLVARHEELGQDTARIRSQSMDGMSNLDRGGRRHGSTGW